MLSIVKAAQLGRHVAEVLSATPPQPFGSAPDNMAVKHVAKYSRPPSWAVIRDCQERVQSFQTGTSEAKLSYGGQGSCFQKSSLRPLNCRLQGQTAGAFN